MKIYGKQVVETVIDRICDVCGNSVMIDINGHKYEEAGELKADWGYGSREDGTSYHMDLCQDCFKVALIALKDHRRSIVMFDEEHELPGDDFGIDKSRTLYLPSTNSKSR